MANFFITQNYLVSNGFINANVDVNIYKSLVEFSAKAFIQPMIGTHFFNDLLTKYNAKTLSTDEDTIVKIIQKCIAFRVKAQTAVDSSFQLTNKGIVRQSDDNATAADKSEVAWIYDHNISHVILFQAELTKYLEDNKDLFPEFISSSNDDSSIKKSCSSNDNNGYSESNGLMFI